MKLSQKKSKYLAGWEIDFENEKELTKILLTHGVDNAGFKLFREIQTATELVIENNKIIKVIQHSAGGKESEKTNYELPIAEWKDRKVFYLQKDNSGNHIIGGQKPDNFILPICEKLKSPFIYLGSIDCNDQFFSWIKLDKLHLAYPIYEGSFEIFLDYQDSNNPIILNPEIFEYSWIEGDVKGVDKVEFSKQYYYSADKIDIADYQDNEQDILLCGVPLWLQYPQIPICPKSGKVMQFVMSINSDESIEIEDQSGIENLPFGNNLTFGDCGILYVFYEPDTKILYLNTQF